MSGRGPAWGAWTAAALGTVAIALAIGHLVWNAATEPQTAAAGAAGRGPSIIVLPFESLSDEPAKAYLEAGITEEILTSLAQFKELFVYARETQRTLRLCREPSGAPSRAWRPLRPARHCQGGGGTGPRHRSSGRRWIQVWAAAYEEVGIGADLFRVQTDIAQRVVTGVAQPYGVIARADTRRMQAKAPQNRSAYDCVLQVLNHYRHLSAARVEEARACLKRATESEPQYADAWALL
jgi:adenylate cyclase